MYYLGIIGGEGGEGGERNPFDCGWEGGGEKAMPLGEDVRILMRFYYAHGYWRKMVTSIGGLKTVFNNSYTFFYVELAPTASILDTPGATAIAKLI